MIKAFVAITFLLAGISLSAQVPNEKTLLWQVRGDGIRNASYIYGTVHVMCPQDLKVPSLVKEKFNTTTQLYLELDIDDPKMMMEMMKALPMKDSSTIKGLLGEARFDSVNKVFRKRTGFSLDVMDRAKPILLMALVYPSMLGCTPESWEKAFQNLAVQRNMEIKGLEDVSGQVAAFEKIPYKVQADMLAKMMIDIDSSEKAFKKMLELYKAKDISALLEMTTADEDFGDYEGILLKDRNRNWIPIIGEQAKKHSTFFAFGAGHLGGKDGVINLLRRAGFLVDPILYK